MQVLNDLYIEINRIFIAGSRFAKNDPRIAKHIPVLEKMGERAPVLKKLAEKVAALVESGEPEALTDAGTFLYAVMATQGSCSADGETVETEPLIRELPVTDVSYLRLKPVLEALTMSRQGRHEVVKTAFEDGLTNDFRLYAPLVAALDDKYAELAEYLYKTVIPKVGAPVIPYLLEGYDPKGKKGDAMRLALLGSLRYEGAEALAMAAIGESDPVIAVEGVKILGLNPKNEDYLLKLAGDRKAAIREAALIGLAVMGSSRGKARMLETLTSAKFKSAVSAAGACSDREYTSQILSIVQAQYEKTITADDGAFSTENEKLNDLFPALAGKNDQAVFDFYINVMEDTRYSKLMRKEKNRGYIRNVRRLIRDDLLSAPEEEAISIFERTLTMELAREVGAIAMPYFRIAVKRYDKDRVFDVFKPYYSEGVIGFDNMARCEGFIITERWKKLFIAQEDMAAISELLNEGEELASGMRNAVILQITRCTSQKRSPHYLGGAVGRCIDVTQKKSGILFKSDFDKLAEACYLYFEKMDGYEMERFYEKIGQERFIKLFYPAYAAKFKALVPLKRGRGYQAMSEALESAARS